MAFPVFQRPVGTPEQTSPWNNILSNALKTYKQGVGAHYAPQMAQADIISKSLSPLAAIASSPLMEAMAPQQKQQVIQQLSYMLSNLQGQQRNQGQQGGLLNHLFHPFGGAGNQNPMQQNQGSQQTNPFQGNANQQVGQMQRDEMGNNVPLMPNKTGTIGQGAAENALTPYRQSQVEPGKLYTPPNSNTVLSPLTGGNIGSTQSSIIQQEELLPAFNQAMNFYPHISTALKGKWDRTLSRLHFKDPQIANDYKLFKDAQSRMEAALVHAGLNPEQAKNTVDTGLGTTNYPERLQANIQYALAKIAREKSRLGGGIQVNGSNELPNIPDTAVPTGAMRGEETPEGGYKFTPVKPNNKTSNEQKPLSDMSLEELKALRKGMK